MLKVILPSLLVICKFVAIYGVCSWDNCPTWSNDPNILNVHLIPHTHDDLGWLKSVDEYYITEVRYIFNTMTNELLKDPSRRFIYCETGFMKRWLEENPDGIDVIRNLTQSGRLEIINGGWVQPDEAASHYIELIDQYTLGLRILNDSFGECAHPKTAWQIDPFGHSREHANLMAMMGYESLWFAREHYLEHENRKADRSLQMNWHASDDLNTSILTGAFYAHYDAPSGFSFDITRNDEPIQDNPNLENYNRDERVATFVNDVILLYRNSTLTNHIMILMGSDFNYQDANMYFTNIDKLIAGLNQNYKNNLTAFYSTPSCYTQAIKSVSGVQWPQKYTDFFPYASDPVSYWTGYFTSRPTMKGLVRKSSSLIQLIRQLQSITLTSWSDQIRKQIETLERSVALSEHHDAVTGTAKQYVTQDYIMRMMNGWTSGEQVLNNAMQTISQTIKNNMVSLPKQIICRNVNESECTFTSTNNNYIVTVHNANAQPLNTIIKVPLYQNVNGINVTDSQGNSVNYQIASVFNNPGQINNSNIAPFEINFLASVRPLGFRSYFISITPTTLDLISKKNEVGMNINNEVDINLNNFISNGLIQLNFDAQGHLTTFQDLTNGKSYQLKQEFLYYHAADPNNGDGKQNSGAYIFRPMPNTPYRFSGPINLQIVNGSIINEARQIISPWVSQVIRLIPNKKFVEFEWTIGPIPSDDNVGKEVITTYTVNGLNTNGVFYTDANGRQLVKRTRNWAENFIYNNSEPVAGNYYPINSRVIISDGNTSLAVLTDRSHGGSSINDGQVEIMLHRRFFYHDTFGTPLNENLNEPGRDGRGLVVRGKHWLVLGNVSAVTNAHRTLAYEMIHAPVYTFSNYTSNDQYRNDFVTDFSGLQQALPPNINLLTLKQVNSNTVIIRLEHVYQTNEDPTLSKTVSIDLNSLIPNYNITQVQELSLAANVILSTTANTTVTLNPMEIKTHQLTVVSNNFGNQPITGTTISTPTSATGGNTATTPASTGAPSAATSAPTGAPSATCTWNVGSIKALILSMLIVLFCFYQ